MIGYLKGIIIKQSNDSVILNVNNVGYKVYTNPAKVSINQEIEFFIFTSVTQDDFRLFGFSSQEELKVFESLIEVSGVGPKLGQQIISFMGMESFAKAVNSQETTMFSAVPKVGPKLASKIIIELKDKVSWQNAGGLIAQNPQMENLIDTLEQLGYKKSEFIQLIIKIPQELTTESEKIRWMLSTLGKK